MERRVLITIVACMALLIAWMVFFMPKQPRPEPGTEAAQPAAAAPLTPPVPAQPGAPAGASPTPLGADGQPQAAPAERAAETVQRIEMPGLYRAEFSSWGGRIRSFELLNPQYMEGDEQRGIIEIVKGWFGGPKPAPRGEPRPLDLVTVPDEAMWPLGVSLPGSGLELAGRESYQLVQAARDRLIYRWQDPAGRVAIEKDFRFSTSDYPIQLEVRVRNLGSTPLPETLFLTLAGSQDPKSASGGMFGGIPNVRAALCYVQGELQREAIRDLTSAWAGHAGSVFWAGTEDQYFLQAVLPDELSPEERQRMGCSYRAEGENVTVALNTAPRQLAPGETSTHKFRVYFGPKEFHRLKAQGAELHKAVNFGWFAIICEPMLWVMRRFHEWTGNWGVAIIFLTLLVKLLLLYFTTKSFQSMAAMQKVKPEMDKLKEKYANDREKMNQELMKLYQRHKINPLGGCLPMVLQMPIYFALYRTIYSSVELYRADFFWYIQDLSAPDPYLLTPLLLGGIMFLQQRLTPTGMDSAQAKMMQWMMPIMFTGFMLFLPSGLVVYILANSTLSIAQQAYIQRKGPGGPSLKALGQRLGLVAREG